MTTSMREKSNVGIKRDHGHENGLSNSAAHRPVKKTKLFDDSDESDGASGGVSLKVNEEFARRFEHNKKREEQHRRKSNLWGWFNDHSNHSSGGEVRQI